MPTGNLGSGSDSAEYDRQRWGMQGLAYMADGIRSAVVIVKKATATRKIQQRQAQQRSADASQPGFGRFWSGLPHVCKVTPIPAL